MGSVGPSAETAAAARRRKLCAELYERSGADGFGLPEEDFAAALAQVADKYLDANADEARREEFLRGLRLEELALARACAAGHERAWEVFLTRYRAKLYEAAHAITRDDSRELADSLYADLYGASERDGKRVSKLAYYMGRGSLGGWLRATLAQEHINHIRRGRRLVSLEEKTEAGEQFAAPDPPPEAPPDPRLAAAVDAALAFLAAEDRFIVGSYYLDQRRLADIARILGVHESTVSRKLERITDGLRRSVLAGLVKQGMSQGQAEEALETDVRDVSVDMRRGLAQEALKHPFLDKGRS